MALSPKQPRTIVFVDGQNLYYAIKTAFGYSYPNYDVTVLARRITSEQGWNLAQVRFYTGVPSREDNAFWNHFWIHKLAQMGRTGVHVYSRPLRYRNQTFRLPDGQESTVLVGQEKGVDVRLALDIVGLAVNHHYDIAVILSQDQDLSEAVDEVKLIARTQQRWVRIASAFPVSPTYTNRRGIDKTDWIRIDRPTYDACIDRRDYRPKRAKRS